MASLSMWALLGLVALASAASAANVRFPIGGKLPDGGKIWALLVAGSNGYYNYRHQADVCHAYQILHKNGIPDENIVVMMYDDIARNSQNPTPNVIINRPGGDDVYGGVPIDYSGKDVTPKNFLSALLGDKKALAGIGSGKVIASGPKDHVFVNFVDHGAPGLLGFPSEELYAKDLIATLKKLTEEKRYKKMVLYIEACESGSMFDGILPDDTNIYGVTAANPDESSYACYYDEKRGTYLGDLFSVKWMENSDVEDLSKLSLHYQFEIVRNLTTDSHVMEYGDVDVGFLPVGLFQGFSGKPSVNSWRKTAPVRDAVSSRDVPMEILKRQIASTDDRTPLMKQQLQSKLQRAEKLRRVVDDVVSEIVSHIAAGDDQRAEFLLESKNKLTLEKLDCYESLVKQFSASCFKLSKNPYTLTKLPVFINVCSAPWASSHDGLEAMSKICEPRELPTGIF